jgi:hypothetical protein
MVMLSISSEADRLELKARLEFDAEEFENLRRDRSEKKSASAGR